MGQIALVIRRGAHLIEMLNDFGDGIFGERARPLGGGEVRHDVANSESEGLVALFQPSQMRREEFDADELVPDDEGAGWASVLTHRAQLTEVMQ